MIQPPPRLEAKRNFVKFYVAKRNFATGEIGKISGRKKKSRAFIRRAGEKNLSPYKEAKQEVLESFTHQYMKEILQLIGGNVSEAARISGIGRVALQKLLRRIRLDADEFRH